MTLDELQNSDPSIQTVKKWIKEKKRPLSKDFVGNYFLQSLWNHFDRLSIENRLVFQRWDSVGTDQSHYQAVVPMKERRNILKYCHDVRSSGHLGVTKTLARVRQRFYWPGLQGDVRRYVSGCHSCSRRKGPTQKKRAPMQTEQAGVPMERTATYILGEFPESELGNIYIVVISDYFTKWTEAFAMPNMESRTVAKLLVEEVVARFGVPRTIHADQGSQYQSKLFTEMYNLLDIRKTRTTPFHPQSNGMVERFNWTLEAMLSAFVEEN